MVQKVLPLPFLEGGGSHARLILVEFDSENLILYLQHQIVKDSSEDKEKRYSRKILLVNENNLIPHL